MERQPSCCETWSAMSWVLVLRHFVCRSSGVSYFGNISNPKMPSDRQWQCSTALVKQLFEFAQMNPKIVGIEVGILGDILLQRGRGVFILAITVTISLNCAQFNHWILRCQWLSCLACTVPLVLEGLFILLWALRGFSKRQTAALQYSQMSCRPHSRNKPKTAKLCDSKSNSSLRIVRKMRIYANQVWLCEWDSQVSTVIVSCSKVTTSLDSKCSTVWV